MFSPKGFPDLVLCRVPRMVYAELKVDGDNPTPDQKEWLEILSRCPQNEVFLWYYKDWDEIVRVLD